MDPIRPISSPAENIPPVVAAARVDRVTQRNRNPGERDEREPEPEDDDDDETPPDDEHPHVDVSA